MTGMSSAHCYVHDHQNYFSHHLSQRSLILFFSFISLFFFLSSLIFVFMSTDAILG